jgi:hypothetical protein
LNLGRQGKTSPLDYLTAEELIRLMEKRGIRTDVGNPTCVRVELGTAGDRDISHTLLGRGRAECARGKA